MRLLIFLKVISIFLCPPGFAQTISDKKKIYETVVWKFADKNVPIINETLTKIYKYDIDGNFEWFYGRRGRVIKDSSQISVSLICVLPVHYSQSVAAYLAAKNIIIDTANLLNQIDNVITDSLAKYVSYNRFVSIKKAPLSNSKIGNLFKKRKVVGLSSILFDKENNIALLKMQVYSRRKWQSENPSKLFILKNEGASWTIIGELNEKM